MKDLSGHVEFLIKKRKTAMENILEGVNKDVTVEFDGNIYKIMIKWWYNHSDDKVVQEMINTLRKINGRILSDFISNFIPENRYEITYI